MVRSDKNEVTKSLENVFHTYRDLLLKYRGEFGLLDSDKWFKDLQVDYFLELFLANLNYTTFLCENILDEQKFDNGEPLEAIMPDHDLGYKISEDCTSVIEFALENDEYVRSTLTTELLYSFVQYFNISNSANRFGWLDVNKRMAGAIVALIQFNPELKDLLDEWAQDIDDLDDDDLEDDQIPKQLLWKYQFINAIREHLEPNSETDY